MKRTKSLNPACLMEAFVEQLQPYYESRLAGFATSRDHRPFTIEMDLLRKAKIYANTTFCINNEEWITVIVYIDVKTKKISSMY